MSTTTKLVIGLVVVALIIIALVVPLYIEKEVCAKEDNYYFKYAKNGYGQLRKIPEANTHTFYAFTDDKCTKKSGTV